jgi:hypothetical protein
MISNMETTFLFPDGRRTSKEAHNILQPFYEKLVDCIRSGIQYWQELQRSKSDICASFTPRTIAGIINDGMQHRARQVFTGADKNIKVSSELGFLVIDFFGSIALRLKKLDSELRPRNLITIQQQQFADHLLFDEVTNVTAGYRLDATGTEIRDMHIVCWEGKYLAWNLLLPDRSGEETVSGMPITTLPEKPIVIAKNAKKAVGHGSD